MIMSETSTQAPSPGSAEDERRRRSRLFFLLLILVALCLCLVVGVAGASGGLLTYLRRLTPTPTETTPPPADQPVPTDSVTETEVVTEPSITPSDTPSPTASSTKKPSPTPTKTATATEGTCQVIVGDGKCDVRCENTDLDSQDCTCNMNNICEPGEGLNCPDCSYGQCGQACGSNADCHNPGLTCQNGLCGGPMCGSSNQPCACKCPKGPGTCRVGINTCTGLKCVP